MSVQQFRLESRFGDINSIQGNIYKIRELWINLKHSSVVYPTYIYNPNRAAVQSGGTIWFEVQVLDRNQREMVRF